MSAACAASRDHKVTRCFAFALLAALLDALIASAVPHAPAPKTMMFMGWFEMFSTLLSKLFTILLIAA